MRQSTLAGIAWMVAAGLCFVALTAIVRHLGPGIPAAQGAFLRFGFGLLFVAPVALGVLWRGLPADLSRPVLWRGAVHTLAVMCWFFALARLPVAEATAIGYLNPAIVMAGGALVYAEAQSGRRWLALAVALAGALIVLRPGLRELSAAHLAQVAAALFFAASYLIAKGLSARLPAGAVVALLSLTVTLGLAPFALAVWVPVTWVELAWLAAVAGLATAGHYTMTRAFAAAPLGATQPVTLLQLVWATLIGAAVFGDAVDPFVPAGGAVIVLAISALALTEGMVLRRTAGDSAQG
jgi:drug/metabolite transporter (DMT)-like permease